LVTYICNLASNNNYSVPMSLRIEHLIKPYSLMTEDEQIELIRNIRHNRFYVVETKATTKAKNVERKATVRNKSAAKHALLSLLRDMSPEERQEFISVSNKEE
jgi:hypothetical protein